MTNQPDENRILRKALELACLELYNIEHIVDVRSDIDEFIERAKKDIK